MRLYPRLSSNDPLTLDPSPHRMGRGENHAVPVRHAVPVYGPDACAQRNEAHPLPTSKVVELIKIFAVIATGFAMVGVARGATASFGTNPPLLGSIIISNLTGAVAPGGSPNNPPNSNVDDPKYVAFDQPAQGQTFTTGPNASGYKLM